MSSKQHMDISGSAEKTSAKSHGKKDEKNVKANKNSPPPVKLSRKLSGNKYFNALLSILLASLVWVFVRTYTNPPTTKDIRVSLTARNYEYLEDNNLLLMNGSYINDSIIVTAQGRQEDIDKLSQLNFRASYDYEKVQSADDKEIAVDLETFNVDDNVKISFFPEKVSVRIENEISVSVPITSNDVMGRVKNGYALTNITLSQSEFMFRGAESIVGRYGHLEALIDVSDMGGNELKPVLCKLFSVSGEEIKPIGGDVYVMADLEVAREISVAVEVMGEVEDHYYVSEINVSPVSVLLHGPAMILGSIERLRTEVVDISGASKDVNVKRKIIVPDGTAIHPTTLLEVDIEIKILRQESRQITLGPDNFNFVNRAPNMRYEILDQEVRLMLIGRADDFLELEVDDIIASVDVAGLREGIHSVLLSITPPDNFTVFGDYVVDVSVSIVTPGRNPTQTPAPTPAPTPTPTPEEGYGDGDGGENGEGEGVNGDSGGGDVVGGEGDDNRGDDGGDGGDDNGGGGDGGGGDDSGGKGSGGDDVGGGDGDGNGADSGEDGEGGDEGGGGVTGDGSGGSGSSSSGAAAVVMYDGSGEGGDNATDENSGNGSVGGGSIGGGGSNSGSRSSVGGGENNGGGSGGNNSSNSSSSGSGGNNGSNSSSSGSGGNNGSGGAVVIYQGSDSGDDTGGLIDADAPTVEEKRRTRPQTELGRD